MGGVLTKVSKIKGVSSPKASVDSAYHSVSHVSNIECFALFDVCVSWHAVFVSYELDLCGSTLVCRFSAFSDNYVGLLDCRRVLRKSTELEDF